MSALQETSLLFLDDTEYFLKEAKEFCSRKGYKLETSDSMDSIVKAMKNEIDIFICDLQLDHVGIEKRGNVILNEIREKNKDIFLVLYTAYERTLSKEEKELLEKNKIKIYIKNTIDLLFLNLEKDYKKFRKMRLEEKESASVITPDVIFERLKLEVMAQLGRVSNQAMVIPVSGEDHDFTVAQLRKEVGRETRAGKSFIMDWILTAALIKEIKEN